MMNAKDIRRENLRALAKSIGGITALARMLGKSQSQISHLIGTNPIKNIGDRLAGQIEKVFNKPHGWLDHEHPELVKLLGLDNSLQKRGFNLEWIPLIHWQQINYWLSHDEYIASLIHEYVPINFAASKKTFALKIQNDSLFQEIYPKTARDLMVIIEPAHTPKNNDIVVAALGREEEINIRQFSEEGQRFFLRPLRGNLPTVEVNEQNKIIGCLKQIVATLD